VAFSRVTGPSLGALALLAILVALLLSGGGGDEGGTEREREAERRAQVVTVLDVVDGDTIEVSLDGREEDVRYIGVDTPESVAPGEPVECFGPEASALNERLVVGERVRLVLGVEQRDRYGRLLAYVYRDELFINAELVRRGFARTLTIAPNDAFAERFARLERAAGAAGRGLWGACGT
jgi:micrococcal nuclease